MTLDCVNFKPCGLAGGGCCAAGHYGGSVSYGVCTRACPHRSPGHLHEFPDPPPPMAVAGAGAALWEEIHRRPLVFSGDVDVELAYWEAMPGRLPFGCGCRDHLIARLGRRPPLLASRAAYALWTFDLHTDTNLRLHKPGVTLGNAADRYGWWALPRFDVGLLPAVAA